MEKESKRKKKGGNGQTEEERDSERNKEVGEAERHIAS